MVENAISGWKSAITRNVTERMDAFQNPTEFDFGGGLFSSTDLTLWEALWNPQFVKLPKPNALDGTTLLCPTFPDV